jgi:aminoglycoside phosphotransferase (APT) family kinase protein
MERVDGIDQFSVVAARPWTLPSIGIGLGRIHADLHRPEVPDELPSIHELITNRIHESARVPADIAGAALAALEDLPGGRSLCHGDFHPGNVLVTDGGPVVIDWTNASRGPAMADFARTRLMLAVGELPPGSPALIRALAVAGRGLLRRLYIRGYRGAGALDLQLAARWEPVRAADRLGEEIEGERDALLGIARQGLGLAAGS